MQYKEVSQKGAWVGTRHLIWSRRGGQLHMAVFLLADQHMVSPDPEGQ